MENPVIHDKSPTTHSLSTNPLSSKIDGSKHSSPPTDNTSQKNQQYHNSMPSSSDETKISKPLHVSSLTESTNSHGPWMLVQYPKNRKSRYPLSLPKSLSPKSPPLPNPIPKTLPRQAWVEKDSSKTSSSLTDKTLNFSLI